MRHLRLLILAAAIAAFPRVARATDTWSDPFPGVRHLHRVTSSQNLDVLVIDLCAPGVGVRTTAYAERGRTAPSFGALVGAQAAINGDFFGSGYSVDGLAASGGAVWPNQADHGYVAPIAFGDHRVEIYPHEAITADESWMTEVVSGHPTVLWDGQFRSDVNGDPLCTNRHPRTIVGLSADHTTLYLAVVNGRATNRIGMTCAEEAALMAEVGASYAMNMDGGGSSTMWMQGPGVVNHPSDGSPRVVGNHLAIYASGSGDAPFCPNRRPRGWLDGSACDAVTGWAQDEDSPDAPIDVHLYFGGPAGAAGAVGLPTRADVARDDLCSAIGSCNHGFTMAPPGGFLDGAPHEVWAYGIDAAGGANAALAGSPMTMQCDPPAPPFAPDGGRKRHIANPDVLAAWRLGFYDVVGLDDAALAVYADGPDLPATPDLVRVSGGDAVYLIDGDELRHVTSPASMRAWRFPWDSVREVTADEVAGLHEGQPLPDQPYVVRGDGPAVYVIDSATPDPGGDPGGDPTDPGGADDGASGGCQSGAGGSALLLSLALLLVPWRRRN